MIKNYPKISVITPSYNQGQFIEETIKSVLYQNYPNLEYIVIDGGSTDNTLSILKKYSSKIKWFSENDKGQSDALNKGLKISTGKILCYLNSDDFFSKKTLFTVADFFIKNPQIKWVTGDYIIVDEIGKEIHSFVRLYKKCLRLFPNSKVIKVANFINQPSTFFKREIFEKIGFFNLDLNYEMDYEYWLRIFSKNFELGYINIPLSCFRIHNQSKGKRQFNMQFKEELTVGKKFCKNEFVNFLHTIHTFFVVKIYNIIKS